ncbi:uncharacterized protein BYT42DRAFT_569121 [Radiomyces spectabilis]|uniref:uncharacterized protein n=1 Tax=Radiomyces spectabilis TaxID=64574 RepID=UPI00222123CA|nr:uncharacterized protein BYT42DRAFT_569121 [Radiomyces spectabilis]KAI8379542.1 hypothetical protein BYT42DRAFT_569121 [Radiomyces spectabilis]
MKFFTCLLLLIGVMVSQAYCWGFDFYSKANYKGKHQTFYSNQGKNDCFNLSKQMTDAKVGSFKWCTARFSDCSVTLHDGLGCTGKKLGATGANAKWNKPKTSAAGSKVKSFRVQGCKWKIDQSKDC